MRVCMIYNLRYLQKKTSIYCLGGGKKEIYKAPVLDVEAF